MATEPIPDGNKPTPKRPERSRTEAFFRENRPDGKSPYGGIDGPDGIEAKEGKDWWKKGTDGIEEGLTKYDD